MDEKRSAADGVAYLKFLQREKVVSSSSSSPSSSFSSAPPLLLVLLISSAVKCVTQQKTPGAERLARMQQDGQHLPHHYPIDYEHGAN